MEHSEVMKPECQIMRWVLSDSPIQKFVQVQKYERVTPGTEHEQNRRAEASCKSGYPSLCIISHRGIAPDLASTCVHTEGIDPYNQLLKRKTLELG